MKKSQDEKIEKLLVKFIEDIYYNEWHSPYEIMCHVGKEFLDKLEKITKEF